MKTKDLNLHVAVQGSVRVNAGSVTRKSKEMMTLDVDLHSKYAEVTAWGGGQDGVPMVLLYATEETLYLDDAKDRGEHTMIELPDFKGWSVYLAGVARYTLSVCLVKD